MTTPQPGPLEQVQVILKGLMSFREGGIQPGCSSSVRAWSIWSYA
jgi:hypothetical protein